MVIGTVTMVISMNLLRYITDSDPSGWLVLAWMIAFYLLIFAYMAKDVSQMHEKDTAEKLVDLETKVAAQAKELERVSGWQEEEE